MTKTLIDAISKIGPLQKEAERIASGEIGFPRAVEWNKDYVLTCYQYMPILLECARRASGDNNALIAIQKILDGVAWAPEAIEEIAKIVTDAGYRIRDLNDVDAEAK